jgi:hypothetical protein
MKNDNANEAFVTLLSKYNATTHSYWLINANLSQFILSDSNRPYEIRISTVVCSLHNINQLAFGV